MNNKYETNSVSPVSLHCHSIITMNNLISPQIQKNSENGIQLKFQTGTE